MRDYLQSAWRCRHFWLALVRMDLRTRYRRSALGVGWSLLHPIAMTVVLCTVFHTFMGLNLREFAPYVLTGLSFWGFMTAATIQGSLCFFRGEAYIRQFPAPLAIYPLRTVLGAGFHFLTALGTAMVLQWGLHGFGNLPSLWILLPTLALLFALGWSVSVLAGLANVYFPDTSHVLEVILQLLFYATPILWVPHIMKDRGLGWLVDYNPLSSWLNLLRQPILFGQVPPWNAYAMAGATVLITSTMAVALLGKLQRRIVFQL